MRKISWLNESFDRKIEARKKEAKTDRILNRQEAAENDRENSFKDMMLHKWEDIPFSESNLGNSSGVGFDFKFFSDRLNRFLCGSKFDQDNSAVFEVKCMNRSELTDYVNDQVEEFYWNPFIFIKMNVFLETTQHQFFLVFMLKSFSSDLTSSGNEIMGNSILNLGPILGSDMDDPAKMKAKAIDLVANTLPAIDIAKYNPDLK